uniref:Uncharacterized protein n=1 Tax=Angiostrongylus cantonensis TaxID=6313 RepID=A0A0K0CZK6_ANGCA
MNTNIDGNHKVPYALTTIKGVRRRLRLCAFVKQISMCSNVPENCLRMILRRVSPLYRSHPVTKFRIGSSMDRRT